MNQESKQQNKANNKPQQPNFQQIMAENKKLKEQVTLLTAKLAEQEKRQPKKIKIKVDEWQYYPILFGALGTLILLLGLLTGRL
jgi:hypothetical protein